MPADPPHAPPRLSSLLAAAPALAQTGGPPPVSAFRYEDVVRRARDLAGAPFEPSPPALPEPLNRLDFDAYRDIRFRPDRALGGGPFRLQLFHLGFLYQRPVTVNVVREACRRRSPTRPQLFDYGRNGSSGCRSISASPAFASTTR